ncbi:hypothetical protein ACFP3Q_12800 [Nocardioides sp. GCM10027113]|uniref:hypothetical protein n=1 Tax=unclassified Nocardioides TaxID=2615069 RepID=UPI00360F193A
MTGRHRRIRNLEGRTDFEVDWPLDWHDQEPGMTAVLRVRNEARNLPWVLPPLFRAVQHVVLVDNLSDDGTPDVARRTAEEVGAADRLTVASYPFQVSRCGSEHLSTPEESVHNLAYFYNWSFSHVPTAYSMKWDGDMVLTPEGVATYADLSWQLEGVEAVVGMPRHPLFVESDRVAYVDLWMINNEDYVFPMSDRFRYVKAFEWELRTIPVETRRMRLPEGLCLELKYLDSDEFDHWADQETWGATDRTMRKLREWEVFQALREGRVDDLDGVVRLEAPPEWDHVIRYASEWWLPRRPRPVAVPPEQQVRRASAQDPSGGTTLRA